jgi:hypothetical protein
MNLIFLLKVWLKLARCCFDEIDGAYHSSVPSSMCADPWGYQRLYIPSTTATVGWFCIPQPVKKTWNSFPLGL